MEIDMVEYRMNNKTFEVHRDDCRYFKRLKDFIGLGFHKDNASAMELARALNPDADACCHCMPDEHED